MSNAVLKPGWRMLRFEQLAQNINDRVDDPKTSGVEHYVGLEHLDSDSLKIRRWGSPDDVEATKLRFQKGDIIFGRRRAYQRKLGVADFEGICSAHALVLRAKPENVLPAFLPFFMQSDIFMERAQAISVGSLSPTINWKTLAKEEFALPPLEVQHKQLKLLQSIEATKDAMGEAVNQLRTLESARVAALNEHSNEETSNFEVSSLLREDPRNGYSPTTTAQLQDFRTLSISAVNNGQLQVEGNEKFANVPSEKIEKFLVQEDDIFVIRGNGNKSLVGRCGIAEKSYTNLFYPDLMIRLRFDETKILSKFAVCLWNSALVHRQLIARSKSTNGIWKINGQDIRKHSLLVPSLDTQKTFLKETEVLKKAEREIHERYSKAVILKQQILTMEA